MKTVKVVGLKKGWVEVVNGIITNNVILPAGKNLIPYDPKFAGMIDGVFGVYQITL